MPSVHLILYHEEMWNKSLRNWYLLIMCDYCMNFRLIILFIIYTKIIRKIIGEIDQILYKLTRKCVFKIENIGKKCQIRVKYIKYFRSNQLKLKNILKLMYKIKKKRILLKSNTFNYVILLTYFVFYRFFL